MGYFDNMNKDINSFSLYGLALPLLMVTLASLYWTCGGSFSSSIAPHQKVLHIVVLSVGFDGAVLFKRTTTRVPVPIF
jgi:hypothetical protein